MELDLKTIMNIVEGAAIGFWGALYLPLKFKHNRLAKIAEEFRTGFIPQKTWQWKKTIISIILAGALILIYQNINKTQNFTPPEGVYQLALILIFAPIIEELFFRGILFQWTLLKQWNGINPIIIKLIGLGAVSILFGYSHMDNSTGFHMVSSILFGALYWWGNRDIKLPILAHFTTNAIITAIQLQII